jgi:polyhydroxybutyrate depolymerase
MLICSAFGCGTEEVAIPADAGASLTPTPARAATPTATATFPAMPPTVFGGERPATLQVPTTYQPSQPLPLLVVLHGYSANGLVQEEYLRLPALIESERILIVAPDGTVDGAGNHFWNATPACCDFGHTMVDDAGYLRGLVADIRRNYNVDPHRIYLIGHSNGAYMAHRLACEAADEIAAIVSLAGSTAADASDCNPSEPVSILDIHGDQDTSVLYAGEQSGEASYPSALETLARWQVYDRCSPQLLTDPTTFNLDNSVPRAETEIQRYEGCADGTGVELWTIRGGGHIPLIARDFPTRVWNWLRDHPKR